MPGYSERNHQIDVGKKAVVRGRSFRMMTGTEEKEEAVVYRWLRRPGGVQMVPSSLRRRGERPGVYPPLLDGEWEHHRHHRWLLLLLLRQRRRAAVVPPLYWPNGAERMGRAALLLHTRPDRVPPRSAPAMPSGAAAVVVLLSTRPSRLRVLRPGHEGAAREKTVYTCGSRAEECPTIMSPPRLRWRPGSLPVPSKGAFWCGLRGG